MAMSHPMHSQEIMKNIQAMLKASMPLRKKRKTFLPSSFTT